MTNMEELTPKICSSLIQKSSSLIGIIDKEGNFKYASPSFRWTLGYEIPELLKQNFFSLINENDSEDIDRAFQLLTGNGTSDVMLSDFRFKHKDGGWIYLEGEMVSQLKNPEVEGIFLNLSDSTQKKLYEEEYTRLLSGVQISEDGFIMTDPEGAIIFVNEAACTYYGCENRRDLMGLNITGIIGENQFSDISRKLVDNQSLSQIEHTFTPMKGDLLTVETSVSMLPESSARQRGFVFSLRDITTRKIAEQELDEYRHNLEQIVEERTAEVKSTINRLETTLEGVVLAMARAVESRDPYTAGHQRRVADLAQAIAVEMGMDVDFVAGIHLAGLIHDLGKIYVPAELLTRPGKLDEVEMMLIRKHPQVGYDILKDIDFPWSISDAVYQHHERLDGTGYPQGITKDEISMEARIIAVADVVESMATNRPYRHSPGLEAALEEIETHAGTRYDGEVAHACATIMKNRTFVLD